MIKKLTIKGFESHEDSVLENFAPGLNAIVGLSQSGKSAIIRALCLVCYNQWEPASLRFGCENCEVEVETERGKVKVTRGKKNLWEITDSSGVVRVYDKIGKQILPQVSEIIGFGLINLGDMEMRVNIMDQLEAHFMLSEFAGQDSTGSLRAQVVDEISGLSGIEGLIRDVSLDTNRLVREINQIEERNKEVQAQIHDEKMLKEEEGRVKAIQALLKTYDDNSEVLFVLNDLVASETREKSELGSKQKELDLLPDEKLAETMVSTAEACMQKSENMAEMEREGRALKLTIEGMDREISLFPDHLKAKQKIEEGHEASLRAQSMQVLLDSHIQAKKQEDGLEETLKGFPDSVSALGLLDTAKTSIDKAVSMKALFDSTKVIVEQHDTAMESLKDLDRLQLKATEEYNEALAKVDVCPVTNNPISGDCQKKAKIK